MGIVGTILLVVIVFGLTAMYYNAHAEQSRALLYEREPYELRQYKQQQRAMLTGEARVVTEIVNDQEVQRYVISIDAAMDRMVRESGR